MSTKLVKGAIFVTIASLLVKVLSIVYKIPYQNLTGDKGFYIFQQLYPIYSLFVAAAGFAIPLSISEQISKGSNKKKILSSSFFLLLTLALVGSFVIILFNPFLAYIFNDFNLAPLFIPLITFIMLLPLAAVIRGYLYGSVDTINCVGISTIIEQVIRVGLIITILFLFNLNYINNLYDVARLSYYGFSAGMLVTLVYLMIKFDFKNLKIKEFDVHLAFNLLKRTSFLLISASTLVLLQLVDSLTILRQLSKLVNRDIAMEIKGVYDRSYPLIQTVIFFVSPLLASLIPHITSKVQLSRLFNIILFLALPATFGIIIVAGDVNRVLFIEDKYTHVLQVNLFIILLYSLLLTFSAIMNNSRKITYIILIGLGLKMLLNMLLILQFGIIGASISSLIALTFIIILVILMNKKQIPFDSLFILKIIFATLIMTICLSVFTAFVPLKDHSLIIRVIFGLFIYLLASFILRIKPKDFLIN